jgi:hypothetical protein
MKRKEIERTKKIFYRGLLSIFLVSTCSYFLFLDFWNNLYAQEVSTSTDQMNMAPKLVMNPLNKEDYDRRLKIMAHGAATSSWPVKTEYPLSGALLPFNRIVAYYGNLYSKKMGVLGEYDTQTMLRKLNQEVIKWNAADPQTPVIPALHYIATTAQGLPQKDKSYILRMPDSEIDKIIATAKTINAIVFLDIQVGQSTIQKELPRLEKYLKLPQVHVGIDPEFSMKTGKKPGTIIGTMNADDINFVTSYLSKIVRDNNLPPKVLTIHRFTEGMLTKYKNIKTPPEVQIVINMDGWGLQVKKIAAYNQVIQDEPVQFTGFKLFYKNDIKLKGSRMLTPVEVLNLKPQPMYIQYQ